jgi:hypothetical protein
MAIHEAAREVYEAVLTLRELIPEKDWEFEELAVRIDDLASERQKALIDPLSAEPADVVVSDYLDELQAAARARVGVRP